MENLQYEVGDWHIATFGEKPIDKRIARKLLEEAAEFMCKPCADEAADVLLVLMAWAHRNNVDLLECAQAKFEIVKARDQKAGE